MTRAAWFPQVTDARTYGPANALNQASSMAGQAFTWNDNGDLTYDGSTVTTFTFDQANRLTAAGRSGMSAAYGYDPEDRRTKKTVNGVVTRMLWSGAEELAQLDALGAAAGAGVGSLFDMVATKIFNVDPEADSFFGSIGRNLGKSAITEQSTRNQSDGQ